MPRGNIRSSSICPVRRQSPYISLSEVLTRFPTPWLSNLRGDILRLWKYCVTHQTFQRRKWHPTPVFLPRESHGQKRLPACCPIGSHRVRHNWSDLACMHALEKEMAALSCILAWSIPGTEEPGGLPSMGLHRVGHNWSDLAAAATPSNFCYFSIHWWNC